MATQWFCKCMGEACGPCSSTDLRGLAASRPSWRTRSFERIVRANWCRRIEPGGLFNASPTPVQEMHYNSVCPHIALEYRPAHS